ncbi:hypothetical protein N801_08800 [Knoellia aerolata DSM 18566]|uniref:HTH tetR-type domain-containing protein n=1 Tax=Knoellia aerolata DSM 18566 TaxID=1385519 RepID=A0A0A0JUU6_9MICO|nr:hypothetical protein N801_08800 [Knoellia aerolata DSM 18566]
MALRMLETSPAEELSVRSVAREVGVSHQAPYVHFGGRQRFLAAVAGAGMRVAAERARQAIEAVPASNPLGRLQALGAAYLAFVRESPHVHDLANGPMVHKGDHPHLQAAAIEYWNLVHDTVAACQPGGTSEADVLRRAAQVWGSAYGISRLGAFSQIPGTVAATTDELVSETIDALYAGWRAAGQSKAGRPPRRPKRK